MKDNQVTRLVLQTIISSVILAFILLFVIRLAIESDFLLEEILLVSIVSAVFCWVLCRNSSVLSNDRNVPKDIKPLILFLSSILVSVFVLLSGLLSLGNIDRSRSLFMFNWIGCAPKTISEESLLIRVEDRFGAEAKRAFKKRIQEQKSRGLVEDSNHHSLTLTLSGKGVLTIARHLSSLYNLKGWEENLLWQDCG